MFNFGLLFIQRSSLKCWPSNVRREQNEIERESVCWLPTRSTPKPRDLLLRKYGNKNLVIFKNIYYSSRAARCYPVLKVILNKARNILCVRDVPDIRFQLAGYPGIFTVQFQFHPKFCMEPDIATRYFTYLTKIDVGKFTCLLATKPC